MNKNTIFLIIGSFIIVSLWSAKYALASYATVIEPQTGKYYSLQGNALQICSMDKQNQLACEKAKDFSFDLIAPPGQKVTLEIVGKSGSNEESLISNELSTSEGNHVKINFVKNGELNRENIDTYFLGENGMVGAFEKYSLQAQYNVGNEPDPSGSLILLSPKSQPDFFVPLGQAIVKAKNQPVCIENQVGAIDLDIEAFPEVEVVLLVMDPVTKEILTDARVTTDAGGKAIYPLKGLEKGASSKIQILGFFGSKRANVSGALIESLMGVKESLVSLNTGTTVELPECIPLDKNVSGVCSNADGSKFAISGLQRIPGARSKFAVVPESSNNPAAPSKDRLVRLSLDKQTGGQSNSDISGSCDIQVNIPSPPANNPPPYQPPKEGCVGPDCNLGLDMDCVEVTPPRNVCYKDDVPNQPCAYSMDCTNLATGEVTHISPLIYLYSNHPRLFQVELTNNHGTIPTFEPATITKDNRSIFFSRNGDIELEAPRSIEWNIFSLPDHSLIALKTGSILQNMIELLETMDIPSAETIRRISEIVSNLPNEITFTNHLFYEFTLDQKSEFERPKAGFVIGSKDMVSFLTGELFDQIGLSDRQEADYLADIMPRLVPAQYYFIGIINEAEWSDKLDLRTNPPVEKTKRIMLYIQGLEKPEPFSEPDISGLKINPDSYDSFLLELGIFVKK